MNNDTQSFNRTIMEIGYMGAFYGMRHHAEKIFEFYQMPHHKGTTQMAAILGSAFVLMGKKHYSDAAMKIEDFLERSHKTDITKQEQDCVRIFLALIYKKAKIRADRLVHLLDEVAPLSDEVLDDNHTNHNINDRGNIEEISKALTRAHLALQES